MSYKAPKASGVPLTADDLLGIKLSSERIETPTAPVQEDPTSPASFFTKMIYGDKIEKK